MKSKKKGSKEPSAKEITKAGPGIKPCSICHKPRVNPKDKSELEQHGKFYQLDKNHFFHFFCLLFSNGAKQLGEDQEGINGFLRSDILNVLDNSLNNKCYICDKNHATSKCHQCSKKFHYTCGSTKEATFVFEASLGNKSFCHLHSPKSKHKLLHDRTCMAGKNTLFVLIHIFFHKLCFLTGCHELVQKSEKSFISPCCGRIYHTACVQAMANSYGSSHFKCPMCNDKERFAKEAATFGIYIPTKDADWEHPDQEQFYEYQQMGELHQTCDALDCRCTKVKPLIFYMTNFALKKNSSKWNL